MSIRDYIINNFKKDGYQAIKTAIEECMESKEEETLPGLGVFFELVWENASQELKNEIIETIRKRVQRGIDSY
jgi:small acid-soluble spore protein I (minor)